MFIFDPSHVVLTSWNQGKLHCVTSKKVTVQRVKYCYVFYQTGRRLGKRSSCTHSQLSTPKTAGDSPLSSCSFKKKNLLGSNQSCFSFHILHVTFLLCLFLFTLALMWHFRSRWQFRASQRDNQRTKKVCRQLSKHCQVLPKSCQSAAEWWSAHRCLWSLFSI